MLKREPSWLDLQALALSMAPGSSRIVLDRDGCRLQISMEYRPCDPPMSSILTAPLGTGIFPASSRAALYDRSRIASW